jgi:hypothetical protein
MKTPQQSDPPGWLGTETLKTRFGGFQFKDGYPVGDAPKRLLDLQKLNRAMCGGASTTVGPSAFKFRWASVSTVSVLAVSSTVRASINCSQMTQWKSTTQLAA